MNDIATVDKKLLLREVFRPGYLVLLLGWSFLWFMVAIEAQAPSASMFFVAMTCLGATIHFMSALARSKRQRFANPRFQNLWDICRDRLERFDKAIAALKRNQIAELTELPGNIHAVANSVYAALRRADMVTKEVTESEGWMMGSAPPIYTPPSHDAQAKELYRIADKNIAEYRLNFANVIASVHRTEAQAAVFTTTLDTLRVKMLGYRLTGKQVEVQSRDFLEAIHEAKQQLAAIDKALEELELEPGPTTITLGTPPPIPTEAHRLQQGAGD